MSAMRDHITVILRVGLDGLVLALSWLSVLLLVYVIGGMQ